nr:dual specificity protein phosphatase 19 isoform X2 [Chlorocebus sabaeus]
MHSLNQEIKAFSRNNLRKQCTRVTTLTGKKIIETWKDARIHVVEEVEPSSGGGCGYVQDLSSDLQVGVIKPWLLLGSQDAAHDLDTLKKNKVTHILNVAYGVENAFLSDFTYKSISILDLPETNILSYFPECFEFIEEAKRKVWLLYHPKYLWTGSTKKLHLNPAWEGGRRENLSAWLPVSLFPIGQSLPVGI